MPAQLQVLGFDDLPMAALDAYQLTTIRQDAGELARRAVKSLVERMEKFAMPGRLKEVPVTLVRRGTTR